MYGPKWPFLLMYGSYNMRHTGFPWVDGLSTDPPGFGASQNDIFKFPRDLHRWNLLMKSSYHIEFYRIPRQSEFTRFSMHRDSGAV